MTTGTLNYWQVMILLALCLAPGLGSVTVALTVLSGIAAIIIMAYRRRVNMREPQWIVAGACILYFAYFLINGAIFDGFREAILSMTPNSSLIFVAVLAIYLGDNKVDLNTAAMGKWATWAVIVTILAAIALFILQPEFRLTGHSVTNLTGVNHRLEMFAGNPLPFGTTLMMISFLALLGFDKKTLCQKMLGFAALITGLFVVVFWTEARGATLVAVPLIGLAIWYVRLPAKTILAGFAGLFVLAGAAYFSSNTIQRIVDNSVLRMGSGVETIVGLQDAGESSMSVRLSLYRAGLKAARQAPVFGYGHPNRVSAISAFTDDAKAPKFSHLHNAFLTHLVAGGVVGLLVFCLFVMTPLIIEKRLRPGSRNSRYMAWMFTITCVGGGLSNLVLNHDLQTNFFGMFVLAHMIVAMNEKGPPNTSQA